jgi:hypothetical protein
MKPTPSSRPPRPWPILALTLLLATAAVLGASDLASVEANDGSYPRPGYGSKEAFQLECELLGGTFWVDEHGNTNCRGSGRWVQCDANGNDCWVTPTQGPLPGGDPGFEQGPVLDESDPASDPGLGHGGVDAHLPDTAPPVAP